MHKFISILLLSIVALSAASCTNEKPNIILLIGDDHRWDALGASGNNSIKTPNLDQLVKEGAYFKNAFVTTSISCSSRASILTGQYVSQNGVEDFNSELTDLQFENSYPMQLKKNDYQIGFVGSYGIGQNELKREKNAFDYFWGVTGQSKFVHMSGTGETIHYTELVQRHAFEFLDQATKSKPFCLSVSFMAPHFEDGQERQFNFAQKYNNLYKEDVLPAFEARKNNSDEEFPGFFENTLESEHNEVLKRWGSRFSTPEKHQKSVKEYYRVVTEVDDVVGKLRAKLEENGLSENTVIIYTSDNGFYLGEHGLAGKWYGREPSIHVPLMIYDPRLEKSRRGKSHEQMALNIDIAPTILALAGVVPDNNMQGKSLTTLYNEESVTWRKQFYCEHFLPIANSPRSQGIRTEKYKYLFYFDSPNGYEELYDIENDPDEMSNLALNDANREVLEELRNKLKKNYQLYK